jgi:hypothetical protein
MTTKKAKKPVKKPVKRRSPRCVVCLANPRDAGYSKICQDCDIDYGVALTMGKGSLEWAATRARETMATRLHKRER